MANNIKLERISIELAKRLNDAFTSADIAVAGDTDGKVISAAQRMVYINKAMLKMFNDFWIQVKGEKRVFAQIFPELVVTRNVMTTNESTYVITNPNFDYFQLIEAMVDGKLASVMPSSYYLTVKSNKIPQISDSSVNPVCIETGRTIHFLPDAAAYQIKSAYLTFIRLPIIGTTGGFLLMDSSTEDSPFLDIWNTQIAAIAEQLFRIDAKE